MGLRHGVIAGLKKYEITKIEGQPTEEDLTQLILELSNALGSVATKLGCGEHGHVGMVIDEMEYITFSKYGERFIAPTNPGLYPKYPDANAIVREQQIAKHKAKQNEYQTFQGVEAYAWKAIVNAVELEWLAEIKSDTMGYNHLTPKMMLTHLGKVGGMLDHMDVTNLMTHLLCMCPAKWQTQYDLTEKTTPVSVRALLPILEKIENNAELDAKPPNMNKTRGAGEKRKMESSDSRIPKKQKSVTFSEKYCALCKKHGGPHKSHNTRDCRRFNPDGTRVKKNGGAVSKGGHANRHRSKDNQREGANFAQLIRKEVKKAFRKQSHKHKKRRSNDSDSDCDSDYSSWSHGSDSTGELVQCKKRKINDSIDEYTTLCPSKAIFKKIARKNFENHAISSRNSEKRLRKNFENRSEIRRCHTCDIGGFSIEISKKNCEKNFENDLKIRRCHTCDIGGCK